MTLSSKRLSLLSLVASLAFATPSAVAQDDFCIRAIEVNQIIQTGTTKMIAGRSTMVRVLLCPAVGGPGSATIDGLLRVYIDGVEVPDSPIYSDNGPLTISGSTNFGILDTTLNFTVIAPAADDVTFEVQVNPPGPNQLPEANLANNIASSRPFDFEVQGVLQLAYAPIDYRPGGGATPNLPDHDLIKPGVGDNFVQGVYPGGLIEYRRIDAESKLWTSSVASSGFSLNSSLAGDLALMSPQPDFIYGWIPGGIGYNGQALLPGVAAMGNTQPSRHQRTYAHELGHNHNRSHNNTTVGLVGLDVERHLNVTQGLPLIKPQNKKDIMAPGLLTPDAWVATNTYDALRVHSSFDPNDAAVTAADTQAMLLVSGEWNRETGALKLEHVVEVPGGRATPAALPGAADVLLRGFTNGELAREIPLTVRTSRDECPECQEIAALEDELAARGADGETDSASPAPPQVGFTVVLPARALNGAALDRLELTGAGSRPLDALSVGASANAPTGRFLTPSLGELLGDQVLVSWETDDADGDAVSATLRYSPDGSEHFVPLLVRSVQNELLVDLATLPHFRSGEGFFELLLSDGFRTTRIQSAPLGGPGAYLGVGGNAPFVEIYHPDAGFSFLQGATVVLHSSGWDLEDFSIDGSSIEWSSDLDGVLGTGRRLGVNDLSPGAHDISVTATDSGGLMTSRTHAITVTPRDLPDVGGRVCASDIGFGGPGASALSLCGEISSGGVSTLSLTGAPASTATYIIAGLDLLPVPLKGGTLVPSGLDVVIFRTTEPDGTLTIPGLAGGGAVLSLYLQAISVDGAQALGYGFSNAVFVEL